MTPDQTAEVYTILRVVGFWLICVSAVIACASVAWHSRVPWRSSEMGRHLMHYMAVVALILSVGVIGNILGLTSLPFAFIRVTTYAFLPVVLAQRLWLQIKAQREDRNDVDAQRDRSDARRDRSDAQRDRNDAQHDRDDAQRDRDDAWQDRDDARNERRDRP